VLEEEVRAALLRPPCGVAFSGGRDSALVLAVATYVARRDGLPEPIPLTRRFPAAEADESQWQELIVRHLGLAEWQRIELTDDLDIVGPLAAEHLRRHGVVWPPAIAGDLPLLRAVSGGSLLDGEGGDQVLEVAAHRVAPLAELLRSPLPLRRRQIKEALLAVSPPGVRARRGADRVINRFPRPWLRPAGVERLRAVLEGAERDRHLSYAASVRSVLVSRAEVLAIDNRRIIADSHRVRQSSPLLCPPFVAALATDGGFLGRRDRTAVLGALAADLLPDAVLSRTTKATFNSCYIASYSRRFAVSWSGDGVDTELVDTEQLRRAWLAERPIPATATLLQAAWLSRDRNGRGVARSVSS
jgi:asparagine synthase (glutamine-hydrolysing)